MEQYVFIRLTGRDMFRLGHDGVSVLLEYGPLMFTRSIRPILAAVLCAMHGPVLNAAEKLTITRQITLSPGHFVMPYLIRRAANGDFIVAGSTNQVDSLAWATRVTSSGEVRWEFRQDSYDGWRDLKPRGQRFFDAVDLGDQGTLLCGIKVVDRRGTAFLLRVQLDGKTQEYVLPPEKEGYIQRVRCIKWNDGIAVFASVIIPSRPAAWLYKLDMRGSQIWRKADPLYGAFDVVDASQGKLVILSLSNGKLALVQVTSSGEIAAKYLLDDHDYQLVRPLGSKLHVRVAVMVSQMKTQVIDFDDDIRGPRHTESLRNAGLRSAIELPNGSIAILGDQWGGGEASASVALLYKNGDSKGFLIEPANQSPWYFDATPTGDDNGLAAVRQLNLAAVMDLITIR